MSDGNYGSTTIGVTMDDIVPEGEKKSVVLDRLLQQEAGFIKKKFKELNEGLGQEGLE